MLKTKGSFSKVKLFHVKTDKMAEFEAFLVNAAAAQQWQPGCIDIKYVKRLFTIDGIEMEDPPGEST